MRLDKLTSRLQAALAAAQSLAVGRDHAAVEPLHVLSALLEDGGVDALLASAGVDVAGLGADVQARLANLPRIGKPTGDVAASAALGRVLNLADREAQRRGDGFVSSAQPVAHERRGHFVALRVEQPVFAHPEVFAGAPLRVEVLGAVLADSISTTSSGSGSSHSL